MNKKHIILTALGSAVISGAAVTSFVSASNNNQGRFYSDERHEKIAKAFENRDYNEWKNLMEGKGSSLRISEENFQKFAEMHKLRQEGKIEEASKIRQELGLGNGQGGKMGQGKRGNFIDENKDGICDHRQ